MKYKNILIFVISILFTVLPTCVYAEDIAYIIGDYVTLRAKPNTSSTKITRVIYGTEVEIVEEVNDWYKIKYDGINYAYTLKSLIKRRSEFTLDDPEYCKTLMESGFPESYCPYLSYVHSKYPTWTYTALDTGLDFYKDVVDGEEGKNYISYMSSDGIRFLKGYVTSKNNEYTQKEAGGWYQANNTVNAYILDPRNFLNEKAIFMFEDLNYNENYQNNTTVSSILGSSFLVTKKDGENSYIDYYVNAGKDNLVSPNHLAARTRQEGASNESYGPVTGTVTSTYDGKSLTGYYNFFNIGAYADTKTKSPQIRGLAYAAGYVNGTSYGRPWNTRKKAIEGGAQFIAKRYVGKGQNTLYFEKFQTNPKSSNSLYTNQYMTNIFAPYEEGLIMRDSYSKNNILETAFNFIIPVYKNMPTVTKQAAMLNGDNLISSINLNGEPLTSFDSDITSYTEYILNTVTEVSITAVLNSSDATIEGIGNYELTEESTLIKLTVKAENGDERVYEINVIRVEDKTMPSDIIENMSVKVNDLNLYDIHTNIAVETMKQTIQKINPNATVVIKNSKGEIETEGIIKTGDTLTIKTLISKEVTYTLSVNGDVSGDGEVNIRDLLIVQKHLLGSTTLEGAYYYAADTNGDSKINNVDLLRVQKHILESISL